MKKNIGLLAAILINVNIIIGAGVFLNVKPLTQIAGPLGFCGYLLGALILFPFVFSLAKLAQAHPVSGGLYVYSKEHLAPFAGFVSGWAYFVGKIVSAAFLALAFTKFIQSQLSFLHPYPTLFLACVVIFSLICLNILGAHIGGNIQYVFIFTKIIPVLFVFITGFIAMEPAHFAVAFKPLTSLISTIPVALYALMGFETICAVGHMLDNPIRNLPRTIIFSFLTVATIYIVFQLAIYGALGSTMFVQTSEMNASPSLTLLANKLFGAYPFVGKFITALVYTSVIAGSFGILTSNCWNFHALAADGHLPGKKFLMSVSATHVPCVGIFLEGIIACFMLLVSVNQVALQSMSVFGVVISFTLSAFAAFAAAKKKQLTNIALWVPAVAIASCFYILFLCLQKIQAAGTSVPFLTLLVGGVVIAVVKKMR